MADIDVKGISVSRRVSDIPARSDDATIRVQSKDDAARQHQRLRWPPARRIERREHHARRGPSGLADGN